MTPAAPLVSLCPPPKPRQAQSRVPTARPYSPSARPKWRGWGWWPSGAENPGAPRGTRGSWGRQWKPEVKRNTEIQIKRWKWLCLFFFRKSRLRINSIWNDIDIKPEILWSDTMKLIWFMCWFYITFFFYIHLHRYWCMPVVCHRPKYNNCVCPQIPLYVDWKQLCLRGE